MKEVYYDPGIGTHGGRLERAFDRATGRGQSENLRQAYRAIIDKYELLNWMALEAPR